MGYWGDLKDDDEGMAPEPAAQRPRRPVWKEEAMNQDDKKTPPPKPSITLGPDGLSVEFPLGNGGTATVQLNEQGARDMMTRLGEFSKNPEVRKRFVRGVLDLFLKATADGKKE